METFGTVNRAGDLLDGIGDLETAIAKSNSSRSAKIGQYARNTGNINLPDDAAHSRQSVRCCEGEVRCCSTDAGRSQKRCELFSGAQPRMSDGRAPDDDMNTLAEDLFAPAKPLLDLLEAVANAHPALKVRAICLFAVSCS